MNPAALHRIYPLGGRELAAVEPLRSTAPARTATLSPRPIIRRWALTGG